MRLVALCLLLGSSVLSFPSGPSIDKLDSWVSVNYEKGEDIPPPPTSLSWKDPSTEIFVGLSAYRDSRCATTVKNLFAKAKHPERLKIGIAQQIHTENDVFDCIADYCKQYQSRGEACKFRSQIHIIEYTHQDARGPVYARYQQQSLITNEEFCMQLDAHSDVIKDWDTEVTAMWASVENEYAVLSSAVPDVSVLKKSDFNGVDQQVPHVCQATFDTRGNLVNLPPTSAVHLTKPILAPLYSAGFSFSKCHAERKVPNDPNLQIVFDVDEFPKFARLWTRGYDVYSPSKIIAVHDYSDNRQQPKEGGPIDPMRWASNGMTPEFNRFLYENSIKRIATLLGYPEGAKDLKSISLLTNYGLGNKRSLDQLIQFTGIDTRKKQVFGDRCMELRWVPFVVDKDPSTIDGDVWGFAPEVLPKGGANIPVVSAESVELLPEALFSESAADFLNRRRRAAVVDSSSVGDASIEVAVEKPNLRLGQTAQRLEADLEEAFRHRGKELWWVFQSVDTAVESLMNHIDEEVGMGHGHRVVKLILLAAPVFVFVLAAAVWVMTVGSGSRIFDNNLKRI